MSMLIDALNAYCPNATPMHMPGHMRSSDLYPYLKMLGAERDITEIGGFDDLHHPTGILRASMDRAARRWGSERARYLVNGSTCGILAAVYVLGMGGGRAVAARNAHKSFYHALEITGVEPVFVSSGFDAQTGACTDVPYESVERALERTSDAKFVYLTSPTYEGAISDVGRICEIAHRRGVPVIVDEAHGAHLDLFGDFTGGSIKAGADIVIQSVHKTLLSLTQTAILHVSGGLVSYPLIEHALDIFETSSPSYLLMASLDGCVCALKKDGSAIFRAWREMIDDFHRRSEAFRRIRLWKGGGAASFDESKLVLMHPNYTGAELMKALRERFSIELEAAYPRYAVAMTGAGTKRESLDRLMEALLVIDGEESKRRLPPPPAFAPLPERVFSVKDALRMPVKIVKAEDALGRVSAEYAWAYPPGVPLFVPGERIGKEQMDVWNEYASSDINTITTLSNPGFLAIVDC